MRGVKRNGHGGLTLLELVLQLGSDIRRRLAPIRVTPRHAGAFLFQRRHAEARVTDAAAALCARLPTLSVMVKALARKRWITNRSSAPTVLLFGTSIKHVSYGRRL
jgi:hypothetical protein